MTTTPKHGTAQDQDGLVVYIHGIGDQEAGEELKSTWDIALFGSDRGARTRMAYWADITRPARTRRTRTLAADEDDGTIDPEDILRSAGIDSENDKAKRFVTGILLAMDGVETGRFGKKVLPLPAFLRRPISGAILRRFLQDAAAYFFDPVRKEQIRRRLVDQLPDDPRVPVTLVAHSLGTVIALEVLSELPGPLNLVKFVTLGSPLGMTEVQDYLEVPKDRRSFVIPRMVQRWHNFADPFDPVAIDKGLSGEFRSKADADESDDVQILDEVIVNERTRQFAKFNPHSAVGYLAHPKVRRSVHDAVRFDTMARFVVARDVAEMLAIEQRHPILIEVLEPGYPALGESAGERDGREKKEMQGRKPKGQAPASPLRLADRIEDAARAITEMVEKLAKGSDESARDAVAGARIDKLRRFVAAHLTPYEIRALALEHKQYNVYAVWRSTSKRKLITRSRAVLQSDAAYESYHARGKGVTWAVLDTGVRSDHPHFKKRIKAIWDCTRRGEPRYLASDTDRDGHGSHVAGIIAGTGARNGDTVLAVAPEADLVVYKVLNEKGEGEDAWIIKALDHIAAQNENALTIHGLNLSLGGPYDSTVYGCGFTPVCQELRRLWRDGVLVVIASGNEGQTEVKTKDGNVELNTPMSIGDPANLEDCIAVGSVNADRPHLYGVSSFSSRGPTSDGRCKPDVVAPGERILSVNSRFDLSEEASHYRVESGTSMAAPHVSGLLAAFLSVRREFVGRPDEVKKLLLETCTSLGRDRNHQGHGIPNLMKMLLSV